MRTARRYMRDGNGDVVLSPQGKAVAVNNQYGNTSIHNQQGTSRQLYDTLPLDARTEFKFFLDCNLRAFPFTNLQRNKLEVGETIVITRLYFCLITQDGSTHNITNVVTFTTAGLQQFYASQWSLKFDTIDVTKPASLTSQLPSFNKNARHTTNEWILFDNEPVVITDLQFQVNLQTVTYVAVANTQMKCVLEGFGTILSPKGQF